MLTIVALREWPACATLTQFDEGHQRPPAASSGSGSSPSTTSVHQIGLSPRADVVRHPRQVQDIVIQDHVGDTGQLQQSARADNA